MGCQSSKLTVAASFPGQKTTITRSPSYLSDKPKSEVSPSQPTCVAEIATAVDQNLTGNQHSTALHSLPVKITEAIELLELLDSEYHWLKQSESKNLSLQKRRAVRSRFVEISERLDTISSEAFDKLGIQLESGTIACNPELLARLCIDRAPRK